MGERAGAAEPPWCWCLLVALVTLGVAWRHARVQSATARRHHRSAPLNLLLLSLDDNVDWDAWDLYYMQTIVATGARNPNGCRAPVTWFSSARAFGRPSSDCRTVRKAYSRGHELATHTVLHKASAVNFTYEEWVAEVGGQRQWLTEACGIPADEVVGFRAPYFKFNPALGRALQDLGFLYDSSLYTRSHEQRGHRMSATKPWPYAYCADSFCANWSSLDLWEVPGFALPGRGPGAGKRVDPLPVDGVSVLQRWLEDFERKAGSGVPVPVFVHKKYLRPKASHHDVVQFLSFAFSQPNTWALTFRQYIDFLEAPPGTPIETILSARRFVCDHT